MIEVRTGFAAAAALLLTAAAPQQLAPISATTLSGEHLELAARRHEVVVVHYWATWCAPCKVEMPLLDVAYRRFHAQGLAMVGIALDAGASRGKVARHDMGVTFPLARVGDTDVPRRDVPGALPETLVYGRDGTLRYTFGADGKTLDAQTLEAILPPLLAER